MEHQAIGVYLVLLVLEKALRSVLRKWQQLREEILPLWSRMPTASISGFSLQLLMYDSLAFYCGFNYMKVFCNYMPIIFFDNYH